MLLRSRQETVVAILLAAVLLLLSRPYLYMTPSPSPSPSSNSSFSSSRRRPASSLNNNKSPSSLSSDPPPEQEDTAPLQPPGKAACRDFLRRARYPETRVTATTYHAKKTFTDGKHYNDKPFCRVEGVIRAERDVEVGFELWLPDEWNGDYYATGNSGLAGLIQHNLQFYGVFRGYAVGSSDSGHTSPKNFAPGPGIKVPFLRNERQTLYWIKHSVHVFSIVSKEFIRQYYGKDVKKSYFQGCSTGGAQGLALAQLYPEDFDGIIAGSPGAYWSHIFLATLYNARTLQSDPSLTQAHLDMITSSVLSTCDTLSDGVADKFLEDPPTCTHSLKTLLCAPNQSPDSAKCLSPTQIATVEKLYAGPQVDGQQLYPGLPKGSEAGWLWQTTLADTLATPFVQNLVYKNLDFSMDWFTFTPSQIRHVARLAGEPLDSIDPDLSAFKARGGKLLVTQGWADSYFSAYWPIEYYEAVQSHLGLSASEQSEFFRLFLGACTGHCGPAHGLDHAPSLLFGLDVLRAWVEDGQTPDRIEAIGPVDGSERTRLWCPYPLKARYKGKGSTDEAGSYECR